MSVPWSQEEVNRRLGLRRGFLGGPTAGAGPRSRPGPDPFGSLDFPMAGDPAAAKNLASPTGVRE